MLQIAADALHRLLSDGREFAPAATPLASGIAISPEDAATCARDARRTAVFLRGVRAAIREARRRFPGERLNAVYAGTGPLATLVVPLLPFLTPGEIRFAFIDIHAEAIESVGSVLRRFGFEDFALELRLADATTYRCAYPLHIAISETMQRALTIEPQVAVMRHLASQLLPGGIAVPEGIALHVGVADPAALFTSPIVPLGVIEKLAVESVFDVPVQPAGFRIVCTAEIVVFGEHRLRPLESGLTYPEVMWNVAVTGEPIAFRYETGQRPGLTARPSAASRPGSGR